MPLAIFDLDNTLLDRAVPLRRWAQRWVDEYGLEPAELDWLIAADGDGFIPREVFLAAVRERYGLTESIEALLVRFRERIVDLVELDPRVPEALGRLRSAGWQVAIATNGGTAQQWAKIRRTGLDTHVDAVAVSEEVGVAKPDRRMFHVAARRCGSDLADGGWMVGDCEVRDIAGAQEVGLRTIWMRRGRAWDPVAQPPTHTVDDLPEAIPLILSSAPG